MTKISNGNSRRLTPLADKRRETQKRSGRFAELLRNLEKGPSRQRKMNDSDSDIAETNPSGIAGPRPVLSSEINSVSTQEAETKPNSDVNKLAAEIVQQFETVDYGVTIQSLNLTFSSKALVGLQVQIEKNQNSIAIHFITDSEPLSKLLIQNTSQLRETLSQKGIKVKGIAVSAQGNRSLGRFARGRAGEQYAG